MAKTNESDVWDQDTQSNGRLGSTFMGQTTNVKQGAKARIVRDAWDDEEEEDQEGDVNETKEVRQDGTNGPLLESAAEDSSKIWEEANKRAPMPELVVASASTSQSVSPPPPAAFQSALRILKRPSTTSAGGVASLSGRPGSSPGSGGTSPAPRGTLAEREAQYQEARSRIFGDALVIVRDPPEPEVVPCPVKGSGTGKKQ